VLISNGFAAMGFGLPAAMAAALVGRGRGKVVCVTGDGGFLMNVQELETAKRLRLPFVVLVWTDGGYGLIEMHQRRKFGHVAGTRFDNPDLVGLARAFGVDGVRVERAGDLPAILAKALDSRGPVVVDIPIDYAENDKLGIDLWQLAPEALA
jgi:acetolactate synthase-1/2/3 large subunit